MRRGLCCFLLISAVHGCGDDGAPADGTSTGEQTTAMSTSSSSSSTGHHRGRRFHHDVAERGYRHADQLRRAAVRSAARLRARGNGPGRLAEQWARLGDQQQQRVRGVHRGLQLRSRALPPNAELLGPVLSALL